MADEGSDSDRIPSEEAPTVPARVTGDSPEAFSQGSRQIGPYRILGLLGEGGFGVVYLAEQQEPIRRRVALKIIKPGMDTKQVIARFEAERQALALMDHPGVAKVLDAGTTDQGRPYFVMEHVSGVPITEHCDRHKLGIEQRLELFIQVCEAVQHAHQKGIIHRDIKPTNILVAIQDGKAMPKVIDFGVAKALSQRLTERTIFTEQGQLIGTPEYISPEQAEMTAQDIDTRSDIYSLGVLLYELLTSTLPFDRESLRRAALAEIQRVIREVEPPKPSTKLSTMITGDGDESTAAARNRRADPRTLTRLLRSDLDWITMKALEKDRTRRYTTASDLAADIQRHLRHEPVIAGPPSAAYRLRKFVRRNRGLVGAVAVVFTVLLLGIGGTTWGLVQTVAARNAQAEQRQAAEAAREAEAEQRREAERQMKIAQAVNEFLQDMLGAPNPWTDEPLAEIPREVKVADVLDAASKEIEGKFEGEPLVEAAVRRTLGITYTNLGRYEEAQSNLRQALALRRAELGEEHPDTLTCMNDLAYLYVQQGRFDEAESLYVETLEISGRFLGEEHPDTLNSMNNLAALYQSQGRNDEAEPLLVKALEIGRRVLGEEHPGTLYFMHNLAGLYLKQGRYDEAEPLAVKRLEISRRVLGEEHPDTLIAMNNLALFYSNRGQYDRAEPLAVETLELMRRVVGEEHPTTLIAMGNLALLYCNQRRYQNAEPLSVKVLDVSRRVYGEEHWRTVLAMSNLGDLYTSLGRLGEAETLLAKAVQSAKEGLPPGHPVTGASLREYGWCLMELERYGEAEPLLQEAHQTLSAALGPGSIQTIEAVGCLVELYDRWGKPEQVAEWRAKLPTTQPAALVTP